MTETDADSIGVVIVLFRPTVDEVARAVHIASLYKGAIVDNSETPAFMSRQIGKMAYITLGGNRGIAKAQNVGMRHLLDDDAVQFVVLFDQDSCFADSYPVDIVSLFRTISRIRPNLAALGPTVIRKETNKVYGSVLHRNADTDLLFNPKQEIIASGCCMSREALDRVGLNDERLFIDFVDCEWCWRARSVGLVCGTTPQLKLFHKVGQRELHLGKHVILISAPFRYYYQYRNLLLLSVRRYVPFKFKLYKGIKAFLRFLYFPFVVRDGREIWKNMLRGILAGIKDLFRHQ